MGTLHFFLFLSRFFAIEGGEGWLEKVEEGEERMILNRRLETIQKEEEERVGVE